MSGVAPIREFVATNIPSVIFGDWLHCHVIPSSLTAMGAVLLLVMSRTAVADAVAVAVVVAASAPLFLPVAIHRFPLQ